MRKEDTAKIKGIAIICMLFHHLFSNAKRYSIYGFSGLIVNQSITMRIASDCVIYASRFLHCLLVTG